MENPDKPKPMTLEDWQRMQGELHRAQQAKEEMLLALGRELQTDRTGWPVMYPLKDDGETDWRTFQGEFLALPVSEIPFMVRKYIDMVETERTNRLCKCEWIVHPDDTEKPMGERRVHKAREAADCPVHTKVGFLLYFFVHYFKSECHYCPPDCKSCSFDPDCECYEHQPGEHYESERHPLKCDWTCPESHFYQSEYSVTDPEGA